MGDTAIEWTDKTWNPTVGCSRVSSGCARCYAFELHDMRHKAWQDGWTDAPAQYHLPFSQVQLKPERLTMPLHWRKPVRVFVNSMSDLFHMDVPEDFIWQVFAVMAACPQHTFQVLTKRPEHMREVLGANDAENKLEVATERLVAEQGWCHADNWEWPLKNVWLGTSVENQHTADQRIPYLLGTPAAVRFLSMEPLLDHVNLHWLDRHVTTGHDDCVYWCQACQRRRSIGAATDAAIHWVIVGGESGKGARVMKLEWALDILEQCKRAEVPVFIKQLGSVIAQAAGMRDKHGGNIEEFHPVDLRAREFPR